MIRLDPLIEALADTRLADWARGLPALLDERLDPAGHGDLPAWLQAVEALPGIRAGAIDFATDCIRIGAPEEIDAATREAIRQDLDRLHPWRKGPFCVFGIHLDSEWRSDWKWARLAPHLADLQGRRVLDVGCGNGYYALRMAGAGARLVIGIDPMRLFLLQFTALQRFHGAHNVFVLPLGIEAFPRRSREFDTVFSLGVLYHRRSPFDHLQQLRDALRCGGELVLETLVIEGGAGEVLVPADRYARMRNVWFIPSTAELLRWLERSGFLNIRVVDVTTTTTTEQRSTQWMRFESLQAGLDPGDPGRTVEDHPAPRRTIVLAEAP